MDQNHNPLPAAPLTPPESVAPTAAPANYTPPMTAPHLNQSNAGDSMSLSDNGDSSAAAAIYICFFASLLAPLALYFALSAKKKAKAVNGPRGFSDTAVIISGIMTALSILAVIAIGLAIAAASFAGIQQRAQDSSSTIQRN